MSNGDDVLDSWEEIDEAGLTNKLHKLQVQHESTEQEENLEFKLPKLNKDTAIVSTGYQSSYSFKPMKLLQRTTSQEASASTASPKSSSTSKTPLDDMAASSFQPVMMVLHQPVDEYQSANYMPPISSQTVKILRRPTQSSETRGGDNRPRQPIKTLQQREQEYAEARLRILGSAKNPEDDVTSNATTNTTTSTAVAAGTKVNGLSKMTLTQNVYNNYQQQELQQQQQQRQPSSPLANVYSASNNNNSKIINSYNNQRLAAAGMDQTWSPVVGGVVSASLALLRQQQQESIVRLPRGPDGSTGFQAPR